MKLRAAFVLGLGVLAGCQGGFDTTVTTVWKTPTPVAGRSFHKVMTLMLNATPAERRAGEDAMAQQIVKGQGIPAYTIIPDQDLPNQQKVQAILQSSGVDGVVVLHLLSADRQTTYYPPTFATDTNDPMYDNGFGGVPLYRGGYTSTDVVIRAEISVYAVEGSKLIWAGYSSTTDPTNVQDLVVQVAGAARNELRRQGLIQ